MQMIPELARYTITSLTYAASKYLKTTIIALFQLQYLYLGISYSLFVYVYLITTSKQAYVDIGIRIVRSPFSNRYM